MSHRKKGLSHSLPGAGMVPKAVMSVEPWGSDENLWCIRGVFADVSREPVRYEKEKYEGHLSFASRADAERGIIENYMFGNYIGGNNIYRQIADIAMRLHAWKVGGELRGRGADYFYWLIDYARARWADGEIA